MAFDIGAQFRQQGSQDVASGHRVQTMIRIRVASANVLKKWGRLDIAWGEANRFRFNGVDLPGDGASGAYGVYKVEMFGTDPSDGRGAAGWVAVGPGVVGG